MDNAIAAVEEKLRKRQQVKEKKVHLFEPHNEKICPRGF